MLFAGGFSFANFLMDVLTRFAFVIWFWLAISVFGDLSAAKTFPVGVRRSG
jgi:hypothetical protein